ncbi:hypothetical protein SLA2020_415790 [Shorea laevis]
MWEKISKSIGDLLLSLQPNCLPNRNRVPCETVHGANMDVQWGRCHVCLEGSRLCICDHSINDSKIVQNGTDIEHHVEANGSFAHAVLNMIGMLIGLGQLSIAYAVETGGWASAFLLIGLGIICAYTSNLLGKCLDKNPKSRSYSDIGHQAFGTKGRVLATTFVYTEIFMALVSYTISLHDNLITVLSGTQIKMAWAKLSSSQFLTITAVLVALPSLWLRNLSAISFLSSSGHIVFPDLYKAMKDPARFTKVSIVSFTLVTALYTALGFMGAKFFGGEVDPQITLSMPKHLIVTKIALWATVLTPMTKYALEFAPFAIQLEHKLPDSMSSKVKMIIRGGVGSCLLLIILALALSVPYFEYVLSLTGSLVSVGISITFPCAFHTKICWGQISRPIMILNLSLIAFGLILGVVGTISSSKLLVQSLRKAHSA